MASKATTAEPEPLVSVKVGSALLGIDERTLRGWLASDPAPFPRYRLSARCVRFRLSDLVRWLETKRGA